MQSGREAHDVRTAAAVKLENMCLDRETGKKEELQLLLHFAMHAACTVSHPRFSSLTTLCNTNLRDR